MVATRDGVPRVRILRPGESNVRAPRLLHGLVEREEAEKKAVDFIGCYQIQCMRYSSGAIQDCASSYT
jgi:hypothetical protein